MHAKYCFDDRTCTMVRRSSDVRPSTMRLNCIWVTDLYVINNSNVIQTEYVQQFCIHVKRGIQNSNLFSTILTSYDNELAIE